jgi:hypothetical protein
MSSMEFWASCIKPGKPVKVNVEDGTTLRLTQVLCLYAESVVHFPIRPIAAQDGARENAKCCNSCGSLSEGSVAAM